MVPGWQKMFIKSASELFEQSSSFHCQLERGFIRFEAVWTFSRRFAQSAR